MIYSHDAGLDGSQGGVSGDSGCHVHPHDQT